MQRKPSLKLLFPMVTIDILHLCNRYESETCHVVIQRFSLSHGQAHLEEMVLNTTLMLLNKPENLSVIAEEVIEVHRKRAREQAVLTLLRDERSKAQKALDNLMKALEAGIFTATTKDRITELELQIDELNGRILSEECKEANLLTKEDVKTFLMDALKAEPQLLIDTLIDKIILFDDKIEIYYKYTQNNNPDEISQEIRRDFCLPSKRRLAVTHRHIIYTGDFGAREIIC